MREEYEEHKIRHLTAREAIRERPEMFIGTSADASTLVVDAMCPAIENSVGGCASTIDIELAADGAVTITDDGPGFDPKPDYVNAIFTSILACRDRKIHAKWSCGNRIVVVTMLSEYLTYETCIAGVVWRTRYEDGELVRPLETVGTGESTQWQRLTFRPLMNYFAAGVTADGIRGFLSSLLAGVNVEKPPADFGRARICVHSDEGVVELYAPSLDS